MKIIYMSNMRHYLFAFAALALSLAACTNDNEVMDNGPVAARINAEISDAVATRASGTTWNENDRIGLTGIGTQYDNVPYIMNGGTFKEDGEPIYFHTPEEVVFRAYYPYDENGKTLKATTDDEAQKNQPKIDFLYATEATASTHNPTVNFTDGTKAGGKDCSFHHCMSQITLTFVAGDGISFSAIQPESYTLSGLVLTGSFDTTTGIAKTDDGAQAANLDMPIGSQLTSSVILFPQTVTALPLYVKYNGERYKATLNIPEGALQAGNNYTYTVKVRNRGIEVSQATIAAWNEIDLGEVGADL